MALRVVFLARAIRDVNAIVDCLSHRSAPGAARWVQALENATKDLEVNASACSWAAEEELEQLGIRQILFKTRRGKMYRMLFKVVADEVRILHVRGAGQAPLTSGDVASP